MSGKVLTPAGCPSLSHLAVVGLVGKVWKLWFRFQIPGSSPQKRDRAEKTKTRNSIRFRCPLFLKLASKEFTFFSEEFHSLRSFILEDVSKELEVRCSERNF